jgi:CspA family cold shock protein
LRWGPGVERWAHGYFPRNRQVVQRGKGLRLHLPDDGGEDVFVHYSGIAGAGFRSLDEGGKVTYAITRGKRGLQAENVSEA